MGSEFSGSDFSGSDFSGSEFSGSEFSGSDFSESEFSGSEFSGSEFFQNYFGVIPISKIEFPISKIHCLYRILDDPITVSKTAQIGIEAGKLNADIGVWYLTTWRLNISHVGINALSLSPPASQ